MSIHIMNAVWEHGPQDLPARMLLLAIADNANERGEAFPSIAVLERKACLSKSSVIRTLRRLTLEGWLAIRRREAAPESYGRARGNLYVISLAKLRPSRGVSVTPRPVVASSTAVDSATSDGENPRSVSLTPRQNCVRDEVSNAGDEVSQTTRRGVKSGVALIVEPSEPSLEPSPLAPQRGDLPRDSDEDELRQRMQQLPRTSPEYFAAARKLIAMRRAREGPAPPEPEAPMGFPHGRRRRRLTEAQKLARVGWGGQ